LKDVVADREDHRGLELNGAERLVERMRRRPTGTRVNLSANEVKIARRMALQLGVCVAARRLSMTTESLKRAIDPEWATRRKQRINELRRGRGTTRRAKRELKTVVQMLRDEALYDPRRDGEQAYASPFAQVLGDPPIGRREMLEANARATAPLHQKGYGMWGGDWHF
jgi:hypothetical protein